MHIKSRGRWDFSKRLQELREKMMKGCVTVLCEQWKRKIKDLTQHRGSAQQPIVLVSCGGELCSSRVQYSPDSKQLKAKIGRKSARRADVSLSPQRKKHSPLRN